MNSGLLLGGLFLIAWGAWTCADRASAERRWERRKADLLSATLSREGYVRMQRGFGAVGIVFGVVLVGLGWPRVS